MSRLSKSIDGSAFSGLDFGGLLGIEFTAGSSDIGEFCGGVCTFDSGSGICGIVFGI